MDIRTIAIIGAGTMGTDITLTLACYNYNVLLKDINQEILNRAEIKIKKDFRLVTMMKRDFASLSIENIIDNITFTTKYDNFDNIEMVIENIPEDWQLKQKLYLESTTTARGGSLIY